MTLNSRLLIGFFVVCNLVIDQLTKLWAEKNFLIWNHPTDVMQYQGLRRLLWEFGQPTPLGQDAGGLHLSFSLNYVRNQGAAWGLFSDWPASIREPFFYLIILVAVLSFSRLLARTPAEHRTARLALVMLISGALGNFTDRVFRGYVVDFIDVRWRIPYPRPVEMSWDFFSGPLAMLNGRISGRSWAYAFPNFNWADSLITVAFFLLVIDMLWLERRRAR